MPTDDNRHHQTPQDTDRWCLSMSGGVGLRLLLSVVHWSIWKYLWDVWGVPVGYWGVVWGYLSGFMKWPKKAICSPTVERGRTDAQSVESQSRKVVIWELICLFTLVRSSFNCQIQIKNMHCGINRGRNYCFFASICGWSTSRFLHAHREAHIRICGSSAWTAWIRNRMANPKLTMYLVGH